MDPYVEKLVQERLERILTERRVAREAARIERLDTALSLVETELGLTEPESAWLGEYVCAVRELREDNLSDPAERDGGELPDQWEQMRREREEELAGIKAVLGPDRYARLREIGGIGLLSDVLDCDDDS